jgi:hypothetical protein
MRGNITCAPLENQCTISSALEVKRGELPI